MNFLFNPAQLSRPQQQSLIEILGVIESENDQEIEVRVIEFPLKFAVKLDDNIEMLLGWDVEKDGYAGMTTPESAANGILKRALDRVAGFLEKPNPVEPEPESQKDTVDLPEPEPEPEPGPDLSPIVFRVHALARTFVGLLEPLSIDQRIELWNDFHKVLWKELWE